MGGLALLRGRIDQIQKSFFVNVPLGPDMQWENLWPVYPGYTVDRGSEDEHEQEEESDRGGGCWLFHRRA